ncbi:MAG: vWA domain-containing protein [Fimbriiglobus sp.]
MDLPAIPTGFPSLVADARTFLAAVSFARPGLVWLALLPGVLAILRIVANRRKRAALAKIGSPTAVSGLLTGPRSGNRLTAVAIALAWPLAILGAAGPRWGDGGDDGVAVGRDVVLVLDLSRSLLADDCANPPSRWETAVAGGLDLVETLRLRGGHRVAVVAFAARPKLLVPLTTDAEHLRATLKQLDGCVPPPEIRPTADGPASGTRIGAALAAAVTAHDPRFPGSQDIILLSDGDDPADDREWAAGVSAARAANIPVHTVGVGDPNRPSPITIVGNILESVDANGVPSPVQTRLREDVLTAIAAEARGRYLPARRDVPRLGEFFRTRIEPNPSRELTGDAVPQPRDRSGWVLAAAAVMLSIAWMREN